MTLYPIIFGPHGGLVAGNGFIAHVLIRGRCLLEETDEEFVSILGVNPGAVAGDGANSGEAYYDFLERVRLVVFDLADEAGNFEAFRASVRQFVYQTNKPNEQLWKAAVTRVRAGEIDLNGVRREDADSDFWVRVELVTRDADEDTTPKQPLRSSLNVAPDDFKIAAGF
ncbi:MAG: hypothetical protein ACOC5M_03440 [Chloroflexota bacterium]